MRDTSRVEAYRIEVTMDDDQLEVLYARLKAMREAGILRTYKIEGCPTPGQTAPTERDLKKHAYTLAVLALQSERYNEDPEYRNAVDNVLVFVA